MLQVRLSKEISSDPSQQYIPRLWYYDSVTFLEDHYFPLKDTRPSNSLDSHYDNYEVPNRFVYSIMSSS